MIDITPRRVWFAMAVVCAGLVLASLALTAWLELHPCHLCISQRMLFMLVAMLALVTALFDRIVARRITGALAAVLAGIGSAVAAYQSQLQIQSPDTISCAVGQPGLIERMVEWLGQQIPTLFFATGLCEEEELVIIGLTLANWALISFAIFLTAAVWALWQDRCLSRTDLLENVP
jgi:protein dithiol:quinone oxidoreductase